ncbi:MAG: NRDE family protein [Acidobacteriota bacterium]
MCTVSWAITDDGYELFCNRDELRSRREAEKPRAFRSEGVEFLAPTDTDAGGTWLAVNHFGITVCLLNRYRDAADLQTQAEGFRSRGLLVRDLANAASASVAWERLGREAMEIYRPFTLLVADGRGGPIEVAWNGRHLSVPTAAEPPLVSSSRDPLGVHRRRRQLFAEQVPREATPAALEAFHRSHLPERGAISPCMHRSDARTVSFTRIRVTRREVEMAYAPGPPCCTPLESSPRVLERLRAADAA